MATQSAILKLWDLATGESAAGPFANWGEITDFNLGALEDTIGEVTSKAVTSLDVTLTDDEERSLLIKATGVLTGNRSILTSGRKGFWFCRNDTTGAFTLTFKPTAGTGIVVPQGGSAILVCDGTNTLNMAAAALASGATDNAVLRADGTAGGIQSSPVIVSDAGVITGGAWNGTVGATTPAAGAFTTLSASGASSLAAISGTTGTFSGTLSGVAATLSSNLTITGDVIFGTDTFMRGQLDILQFFTNNVEMARFSTTALNIGATTPGVNTEGVFLFASGLIQHTRTNNIALQTNRTNDGTVVQIGSAGAFEGNISISGATCTYGTFMGSHWSQPLIVSEIPLCLKGTIVESTSEMSVWPGEINDHLPKFEISKTPGSKKVYGVFAWWDEDDDHGDANIAALGAYMIRIQAGDAVEIGDLIESAGNGCGKVQSDDIFRSKTVGKVDSTFIIETYPDGSYLVPCTLHCG